MTCYRDRCRPRSARHGACVRPRLLPFLSRRVGVAGRYSKKARHSRMPDKTATITEHRLHETDTGSPEVQAALLTGRINHLTEHLKIHRGDHHTRRGLMKLIGRRRRLLDYVKDNDIERYRSLDLPARDPALGSQEPPGVATRSGSHRAAAGAFSPA